MLSVEAFSPGGRESTNTTASRVLIRDHMGNPICLAVSWDEGGKPKTLVAHHGDDDFDSLLQTMGVDKVVVMNRINTRPD